MGCPTGKVSYPSPELAVHAMYHSQSVVKKDSKAPIRYYKCKYCERYHITSEPKKQVVESFLSFIARYYDL